MCPGIGTGVRAVSCCRSAASSPACCCATCRSDICSARARSTSARHGRTGTWQHANCGPAPRCVRPARRPPRACGCGTCAPPRCSAPCAAHRGPDPPRRRGQQAAGRADDEMRPTSDRGGRARRRARPRPCRPAHPCWPDSDAGCRRRCFPGLRVRRCGVPAGPRVVPRRASRAAVRRGSPARLARLCGLLRAVRRAGSEVRRIALSTAQQSARRCKPQRSGPAPVTLGRVHRQMVVHVAAMEGAQRSCQRQSRNSDAILIPPQPRRSSANSIQDKTNPN